MYDEMMATGAVLAGWTTFELAGDKNVLVNGAATAQLALAVGVLEGSGVTRMHHRVQR